jgi:hypothetical protein
MPRWTFIAVPGPRPAENLETAGRVAAVEDGPGEEDGLQAEVEGGPPAEAAGSLPAQVRGEASERRQCRRRLPRRLAPR